MVCRQLEERGEPPVYFLIFKCLLMNRSIPELKNPNFIVGILYI